MNIVLDAIPVTTTAERVAERLLLEDADDILFIRDLYAGIKEVSRPKVIYREAFTEHVQGSLVRINNVDFESPLLAEKLRNAGRVFAFAATCGVEADEWSRREKDYIVILWLDIIKGIILGDALAYFYEHIKKTRGLQNISICAPGSDSQENWPLSQQKPLFELIGDVEGRIGVILTEDSILLPTKSSSGLVIPG